MKVVELWGSYLYQIVIYMFYFMVGKEYTISLQVTKLVVNNGLVYDLCEDYWYDISPRAVRWFFIGFKNITFVASFNGRSEEVKEPINNVYVITGELYEQ